MVRRIETGDERFEFTFDGQTVVARPGDSIAAALIAAGIRHLRDSVVSGEPRGIFCMMGSCFDCLVEVDGVPNRQACMTKAADGLDVRRQRGSVEVQP
ncbi:Hydrogen cyanide synthase subunit HcnA [Nereida ignava]|uniref:Hydrogen cyanide synthase subunit HcnA n=1 Tax=Nereida ignava TaxID=282199 RepID=A0A0U1NNJ7_9RHOB|nr:(2Fe-2S)-binding protein [Nereida ignava]CRK76277.1 Hydrogen cyanide synthase subunit HcnA [Nereida ignava]SFJ81913.1 2Fe-2S iron-sulfur cluster binding domain-containing protein [Nereida ignava DSM 16309]